MSERIDPSAFIGDTDVRFLDLILLGDSLLNWVNAVVTLGHASPASTLDYVNDGAGTPTDRIFRDFVAWTSGRKELAPGCGDRLRALMSDSGWTDWVGGRTELLLEMARTSSAAQQEAA